jgi:diamine N-acetyltransferase
VDFDMKLEGKKCFLRAVEPHDVEWLFKWENNTDIWIVSGTRQPFSKHDLQQYVKGIRDIYIDRQLRLIISTEESPIGSIDLFDYDPDNRRAGIGILIGEADAREKGYASDALDLLIDYAFNILHLHLVYANVPSKNSASRKLFAHSGFEHCGTRRDWLLGRDGWEDEYMFLRLNPNE